MNRIIRIFISFQLLLLFYTGCSEEKRRQETTSVQTQAIASDSIKSESNQTIQSNTPLVTFIELGSDKCIPCKMMQPIMEEIEKEYSDQVKVVFYDVWTEEGQPYAQKYSIRAIPTQIFVDKNGNEYFRHT